MRDLWQPEVIVWWRSSTTKQHVGGRYRSVILYLVKSRVGHTRYFLFFSVYLSTILRRLPFLQFLCSINFRMLHEIKERYNSPFAPNSASESSGCCGCEHLGSLLLSAADLSGTETSGVVLFSRLESQQSQIKHLRMFRLPSSNGPVPIFGFPYFGLRTANRRRWKDQIFKNCLSLHVCQIC